MFVHAAQASVPKKAKAPLLVDSDDDEGDLFGEPKSQPSPAQPTETHENIPQPEVEEKPKKKVLFHACTSNVFHQFLSIYYACNMR